MVYNLLVTRRAFCYHARMVEVLKMLLHDLRAKRMAAAAFFCSGVVLILRWQGLNGDTFRWIAQNDVQLWTCIAVLTGYSLARDIALGLRKLAAERFGTQRERRKLRTLSDNEKILLRAWVDSGTVSGGLQIGQKPVHDLIAAGVLRIVEKTQEFAAGCRIAEVEIAPYSCRYLYSQAGRAAIGAVPREQPIEYR